MEDGPDHETAEAKRKRLLGRVDKMVESGRITHQEAARLRMAGEQGEFDAAIRDIRVRHAGMSLGAAVEGGSLTEEEANRFLERLRKGEHSRSLRDQLRRLRPGVAPSTKAAAPAGAKGDEMTEPPSHPETDDTGGVPERGATTGLPRWMSVLGIVIAVALVLIVVVLHLTGTIGAGTHGG